MKRTILLGRLFTVVAVAAFPTACDEFNNEGAPYIDTPNTAYIPKPPAIDASWNLEPVANIGQHDLRVFVYKDKKYDGLFTRTLGWNGGDGVFTTLLPDGNVFWSFNDSFYGVADGETRARGSCSFPRNSIMIQKADDSGAPGETDDDLVWLADYVQTTAPSAPRYYQARTHIRNPDATLTEAEILAGEIDQDYVYWAGDGTVYNDPIKGTIYQMTWFGVNLTAGGGSMITYKTCLAEYSLEGTPGDGQYMSMISRDDDFKNNGLGYGSTLFEDEDGHIYLYTTEQDGAYNCRTLVARTENLNLGSTWSYYIRTLSGEFQWQTKVPSENERKRSYIQSDPGSMPWVFKSGDMYYMTYQSFPFGRAIYICRSDKPCGPFTDRKLLFTLPETLDKQGDPYFQHWYMINLHMPLSRDGELVFSTNSDTYNFWDNFNRPGSADFYRPYFFRVFNWESLYAEE